MSNIVTHARFVETIDRWRICPSTHCERAQECRAPHECCGTGKNLSPETRERVLQAQREGRPLR